MKIQIFEAGIFPIKFIHTYNHSSEPLQIIEQTHVFIFILFQLLRSNSFYFT